MLIISYINYGQDTVFMKDGRKIAGEITNISVKRITISSDGIIYSLKKTGVNNYYRTKDHLPVIEKIPKTPIDYSYKDSDSLIKKNIIKISPLGIFADKFSFRYERFSIYFLSIELTGGFNWQNHNNHLLKNKIPDGGYFLQYGMKFYIPKKGRKAMSGLYFKPEFLWSHLNYINKQYTSSYYSNHGSYLNKSYYYTDEKQNHSAYILNQGFQLYLTKRILFDVSVGIGFGRYTQTYSNPEIYNLYNTINSFPEVSSNALSHFYLNSPQTSNTKVINCAFSIGYCF